MGYIFNDEAQAGGDNLSRFDTEYSQLENEGGSWEGLPDGQYETRVEEVRLSTTPTTGNPMIIWRLRVLGPNHAGKCLVKTRVITSKTLVHVKRDLETFGVRLERFSELPRHLEAMENREVAVLKRVSAAGWDDVLFLRRKPVAAEAEGFRFASAASGF